MVNSDDEAFIKKPLINRTPKSGNENIQTALYGSAPNNSKHINKRNRENITLEDLLSIMEEKFDKQFDKLDDMKVNFGNEMLQLKSEINENFDKSVHRLDNKIEQIDIKADKGIRLAMENRKTCINFMKQARIENCMDISGLNFTEGNIDLRTLAINTIRSFNIKIDEVEIKKVKSVDIQKSNTITNKLLTVTFDDVDTKARVMREKNKIKSNSGVFFNNTLTPSNGYFMRKAKFITKGTELKPILFDGAVHVKIQERNTIMIQSEDDLIELKKIVEMHLSSSSKSNGSNSNKSSNIEPNSSELSSNTQ